MPFRTLTRTRTHTLTQDAAALEEEAAGEEADRAMDLGEQEDKEPPAAQDTAEQGGRSTQGEQRQGGVGGSDAKPDAMQQDEQDSAQQRAQVGPRGRDEGRSSRQGPRRGRRRRRQLRKSGGRRGSGPRPTPSGRSPRRWRRP